MITTEDKGNLESVFVNGANVNGIGEQILFSSNLIAPPGCKIIKKAKRSFLQKDKQNKIRQDPLFLEDSKQNPVDFNNEYPTVTLQIIKVCST